MLITVIGLTESSIAVGVIIALMVYAGINISGAHYNPAVTVAMIIRKLISLTEAVYYIFSQLTGALFGAILVYCIKGMIMTISPAPYKPILYVLLIEFIFTFILILVILYVTTDKRAEGNYYYGLAIGFIVMIISFFGGGISGGAFNPSVGLGPIFFEVIMGNGEALNNSWYYIFAPIGGAISAVFLYERYID